MTAHGVATLVVLVVLVLSLLVKPEWLGVSVMGLFCLVSLAAWLGGFTDGDF